MSPLGYAVGFVDGHETDRQCSHDGVEFPHKSLGRDVDYLVVAFYCPADYLPVDIFILIGMDGHGRNAVGLKGRHLVDHQGDKRGDNYGASRKKHGRDLIADGFAASCGHKDHCVLALQHA